MKLRNIAFSLVVTLIMFAFAQDFPQLRRFDSPFYSQAELGAGDLAEVYETTRDATVRIETRPAGIGSGFFISPDGQVMTAYHVVRDADALNVVEADGTSYRASVIGFDEYRDLAVLQAQVDRPVSSLQIATETPSAGESVLAIGNSRGDFNAPRSGEVTSLGQRLGGSFPEQLIAMTLPLAPGDSGGPVLNAGGEAVGVVTAVGITRAGYASYAAPLYRAGDLVTDLRMGLQLGVPFLGVSLLELTPQTVAEIDYGESGGLLVTGVVPGSGAEAAGLREPRTAEDGTQGSPNATAVVEADVITEVDGRRISSHDELVEYLRALSVEDEVELTVMRGGEIIEIAVTLGSRGSARDS